VLVADDDGDILELIEIRLRRAGFETIGAGDGEKALRLAFERRPDLCILDVVMPKRTGFDVLGELRVDPETASIPVILVTATVQEREHRALARAADGYLTKPFRPGELEQRVRELLGDGPRLESV
jgi:DNA-binding response OmpR family regulator